MCVTFPACASECSKCTGATATACSACNEGYYIDGTTCKGNQTLLFYMMKLFLLYNFMKGCNYKNKRFTYWYVLSWEGSTTYSVYGVNLLSPNPTTVL